MVGKTIKKINFVSNVRGHTGNLGERKIASK